jgi:hypothetical protein
MRIRAIYLAAFLLAIQCCGKAQSPKYSTYFGVKGFLRADLMNLSPKDKWFHGNKAWFQPSAGGIFASFCTPSGWRAEIGVETCQQYLVLKLGSGKRERGNARFVGATFGPYLAFPVSIGKQFQLLRGHFVIVPQLGMSFINYETSSTSGQNGATDILVNNSVEIDYFIDERGVNSKPLLFLPFAKVTTELYFRSGMRFSTEFGYRVGTSELIAGELHYTVNNGPEVVRNVSVKGNMLWMGVGLQYPISRIWEKKKELFWKKKVAIPQEMTFVEEGGDN